MKSFLKTTSLLLFAVFIAFACKDSYESLVDNRLEDNPPPSEEPVSGESGSADFSNYVAIGNSLTAGFMDGALYNLSQEYSLPALLAERMTYAGAPETFNQPDINSELGYNSAASDPQNGVILGRYKLDTSIPGPSPTVGGELPTAYTGDKSALNNFGVPGIKVGHLLSPLVGDPNNGNPYYARFASSPGSSTILGDAIATQPTFFTLWIGNNDVLQYAIGGASDPSQLTSVSDFGNYLLNTQQSVIPQLMNNTQAKGVLATIPPVTVVPYFQAVPYNAIELSAEEAAQLDANFEQGLNPILDAIAANFPNHSQAEMDARKVNYQEGANPILVNDPTLDDLEDEFDQLEQMGAINAQQRAALVPYEQSRQLQAMQIQGQMVAELVTLPAGSVLGTEYDGDPDNGTPTTIGAIIPLGFPNPQNPDLGCTQAQGDECYLTIQEQQEINARATQFNQIIGQAVAQNPDRLALFDITSGFPGNTTNTEVQAFANLFGLDGQLGINVGGQLLQPDFSPNGVFSTDGIHPNARGNAILANEFIRVIEENFEGADIPEVDVLDLPSVQLCAGNCVSQQQKQKPVIGKINYNTPVVR